MMEEAKRVTAVLEVTAEFYDPEAAPETVRACVKSVAENKQGTLVDMIGENGDA